MDAGEVVKNRIIELCAEKKWAPNALAVFSGVPPSTLKNIISGKSTNLGISTIKKLCDGLGITLGEFFSTKEFDELEQEIK